MQKNLTPEEFIARKKMKPVEKADKKRMRQKEKMQKDRQQAPAYEEFARYCREKTQLVLGLYDGKIYTGAMEDFTPYEFIFHEGKTEKMIHRLKIKYLMEKKHQRGIEKAVLVDQQTRNKKLQPSENPKKRFQFPDDALAVGREIILGLHEGEMVRGVVK